MTEYEADSRRTAEKTARLRALRLAKEEAETAAQSVMPAATQSPARRKLPDQ